MKEAQLPQRLSLPRRTQNLGSLWIQPNIQAQLSPARRCSSKASISVVRANLNRSHLLPQVYHNHHHNHNRNYHCMINLPRQAPIPRLSTKYLNSQNTNHVIKRLQPQTLKYLTEKSILA